MVQNTNASSLKSKTHQRLKFLQLHTNYIDNSCQFLNTYFFYPAWQAWAYHILSNYFSFGGLYRHLAWEPESADNRLVVHEAPYAICTHQIIQIHILSAQQENANGTLKLNNHGSQINFRSGLIPTYACQIPSYELIQGMYLYLHQISTF